jgi:hypothetical protein
MSSEPALCFVGARRGNAFMNELLEAVAYEVGALGVRTEVVRDAFPEEEGLTYVIVPHEYFACAPAGSHPTSAQLARTIGFCTEQPGTPWFETSVTYTRRLRAAVDIQPASVSELRRRGLGVEHFRLGYTEYWDTWRRDETVERPVDVLHLGAVNERRLRALAGYAGTLWPLETRLLVPPEAPKTSERADFLLGEKKWHALRSAKILLNLHRQRSPYFEWVRVLEAVANGCVVVSEHSADVEPLVPGEHFVSGSLENLGLLADHLARNEERLGEMRLAAYDAVRSELPMRPAAERLVEIAAELPRARRRPRRARPEDAGPGRLRRAGRRFRERLLYDPQRAFVLHELAFLRRRAEAQDAALKRVLLGQIEVKRALRTQELVLRGEPAENIREIARTPSYDRGRPRVSVLVPLYNHADDVPRALASVVASDFEPVEVVVLDDASTDGSADAVCAFFERRPFLPGLLLQHPVNRGLGRTRNDLAAAARGEYVFMLDSDNEIYPTALTRLAAALDTAPGTLFAYPMLAEHADGEPDMVRSHLPWEPELLRLGNYIDALSMLRRRELLELGGYTEDHRLYGWEDYDLWCRCAERGHRGLLVPEILARYKRSEYSMLSVTDVDTTEAEAILRERYPTVMRETVAAGVDGD